MQSSRLKDVQKFYELLAQLTEQQSVRRMAEVTGKDGWPSRGVYFFFEQGEVRENGSPRVVRIGTHALIDGATSTLWGRLSQHRGTVTPKGGNHRGSVFRMLVGTALMGRGFPHVASWDVRKPDSKTFRDDERSLEQAVSDHIGAMDVAWIDVPDEPSKASLRGFIERNAIALLSNHERDPIDAASSDWLGHFCDRERVRSSGLWNNNHVDETYDPAFLETFERLVGGLPVETIGNPKEPSMTEPIFVVQCAKSKQNDGWLVGANGQLITFYAKPDAAPAVAVARNAHPDGIDEDGLPWRHKLIEYNRRYRETGENPLGLHSAASLYANRAYAKLEESLPPARLYILSACWGLVRSDFLLPNYDVSFSQGQNVPAYVHRASGEQWHDFNMLPSLETAPLVFIGGQKYLRAFAEASRYYQGHRVAYFNSASTPEFPGVEMRRFDTDAKTNWHYQLIDVLLEGQLPTYSEEQQTPRVETIQKRDIPPKRYAYGSYGKYTALNRYLSDLPADLQQVTLTYSQIEEILEASLPPSSRSRAAVWWANGGHPQAYAWMDAGFRKAAHRLGGDDATSWIRFERV